MQSADLKQISANMKSHNEKMQQELREQWRAIFDRMFDSQPPAAESSKAIREAPSLDFDAAMEALYAVKVHGACEGETHL